MFSLIFLSAIFLLSVYVFYYHRPLFFLESLENKNFLRKRRRREIKVFSTQIHNFPVFTFSVRFRKYFNESSNSLNKILKHKIYKIENEIFESCFIINGLIYVYFKNKIIGKKTEGCIIYLHHLINKDIKYICKQETIIIPFEGKKHSFIYFLHTKKVIFRIFCNYFQRVNILMEHEKKKLFVNNLLLSQNLLKKINKSSENTQNSNVSLSNSSFEIHLNPNDLNFIEKTEIINLKKLFYNKIISVFEIENNTKTQDRIYKSILVEKFEKNNDNIQLNNKFFMILVGEINITQLKKDHKTIINAGCCFGYFDVLFQISENYTFNIEKSSIALTIHSDVLNDLISSYEKLAINTFNDLSHELSLIDATCEWINFKPGMLIENNPKKSNFIYYLNTGRLEIYKASTSENKENQRSHQTNEHNNFILPGSSIGEKEYITDKDFNEIFYAKKSTDIIKISCNLLEYYLNNDPQFAVTFMKKILISSKQQTCKTITIIPTRDIYTSFPNRLRSVLPKNILYLTNKDISIILGKNVFDTLGEIKFLNFLGEKEKQHELILIYIENRYSKLFKYIVNFSDILLTIGRCEFNANIFCNIELVQIYEERIGLKKNLNWIKEFKGKIFEKIRRKKKINTDQDTENKNLYTSSLKNTISRSKEELNSAKYLNNDTERQIDYPIRDETKNVSYLYNAYERQIDNNSKEVANNAVLSNKKIDYIMQVEPTKEELLNNDPGQKIDHDAMIEKNNVESSNNELDNENNFITMEEKKNVELLNDEPDQKINYYIKESDKYTEAHFDQLQDQQKKNSFDINEDDLSGRDINDNSGKRKFNLDEKAKDSNTSSTNHKDYETQVDDYFVDHQFYDQNVEHDNEFMLEASEEMETIYDKIHHILSPEKKHHCMKDYERLARHLLGKKIGLVLSGGGARGFAHIGIIQALEEEDIPIDVVGGTSMGAFIGGLYSRNCDNISVFHDAKKLSKSMVSKRNIFFDLTYPLCSLFSGTGMNRILYKTFKNQKIEDLWLEYFCVTTNVTNSEECIHRDGFLWKYVRASMSLAGYLPPICDVSNSGTVDLLLDGGYVNNIPVDVMLNMGIGKVIAIDVGSVSENTHHNYGESLSGFYALFHKYFGTKKFLSINDIQYRLAYVSSVTKERSINDEKVFLFRPTLDKYETMDFAKIEEIVACGYEYGKKIIKEWKKNGKLGRLTGKERGHKRRFSI